MLRLLIELLLLMLTLKPLNILRVILNLGHLTLLFGHLRLLLVVTVLDLLDQSDLRLFFELILPDVLIVKKHILLLYLRFSLKLLQKLIFLKYFTFQLPYSIERFILLELHIFYRNNTFISLLFWPTLSVRSLSRFSFNQIVSFSLPICSV